MRILLIARTIKSYWATEYAQGQITESFAPFSNSQLWRIFGGIFSWPLYFIVACLGFLKSRNFDLVIASDPRIGIFFAILKKITGSKKPILVHQLILSDVEGFKKWILKLAFAEIDAAIVNSSYEKETLEKIFTRTKFFFIPIHSDPRCFKLAKRAVSGTYIFSGGGAERDFKTLIKAAKNIDLPILIVTFSEKNLPQIKLPKNIKVQFNVPEEKYFKLIANSKLVVVPLEKTGRSAGQTTVVQAMSIGKVVVATNVLGLADYLKDQQTGVLVRSEHPEDLIEAFNEFTTDKTKLKRIEKAAFKFAYENFSYKVYDKRISKVISTLKV